MAHINILKSFTFHTTQHRHGAAYEKIKKKLDNFTGNAHIRRELTEIRARLEIAILEWNYAEADRIADFAERLINQGNRQND